MTCPQSLDHKTGKMRCIWTNAAGSEFDGLDRHLHLGIAGGEGVVVGEDHLFCAVAAEGGFVVAADDGEGVEDVGGVISRERP